MTTTTTTTNDVGPFNENEILETTKKAVVELVNLDFDQLEGSQKEAFVAQAIGALAGIDAAPIQAQHGETPTIVATEFRRLVLQEFMKSPKWDLDEFIAGYAYNGLVGKA